MRRAIFTLALSFLSLAAGVLAHAQDAPAETDPAETRAAVQTATIEAARITPIEERIPVTGSLVARQKALVFPQISGFEIVEILAEAGDHVEKGQVLARLSDATARAQLAQARAEAQRADAAVGQARSQIDSAEASATQADSALARTERLKRSGTATSAALDQVVANAASARAAASSAREGLAVAEAARAQAKAAIDIAQLNLDRTVITAPVGGVVAARDAELGALGGAAGGPMFTIVADGEIEWQAEVVETALDQLGKGNPAIASVAGVGEVTGEVRLLPATVDPATRLGELRIALDRVEGLRTGLFASGWVIVSRHEGLSVPMTAVLTGMPGREGDVVQVVADGVVKTRPVRAGAIWQGRREILSGLTEGETVITRAGAFFRDGDRIDAVRAPETMPAPAEGQDAP